jgi:hypothetical protein
VIKQLNTDKKYINSLYSRKKKTKIKHKINGIITISKTFLENSF